MTPFDFEVVTPERALCSGETEMVSVRSTVGEIAFLAGHVPYIGALVPCVARVHRPGGGIEAIAVQGGFVEVVDEKVTLLAGIAETPEEIDVDRARRARAAAEAAGDEAALRRAEVRLELVDAL